MFNADPPCDFIAFVAERHELEPHAAEALVRDWLVSYERRGARDQVDTVSASDDSQFDELPVCA